MKHQLLQTCFNGLYHFFSLFSSSKEKTVVFCSNRSKTLSGNLEALYDVFKQEQEWKVITQTFHFERTVKGRLVYVLQSIKMMYLLANASLFIIDDYVLPIYYVTNKKQKNQVVQVWHAIGHLKKYGLSLEKNQGSLIKHHSNYDWVLSNAPSDNQALMRSFGVSEKQLLLTGAPRLDNLIQEGKVGPRHLQSTDKRYYMYAPTYRDATNTDAAYQIIREFLLAFAEQSDPERDYLYLSLHPYLKAQLIGGEALPNVEIFSDGNQSSKLLQEIDVLVTDYSSILLDYAYFEKPLLIFAPDYQTYIQKTGFFVDYQSYIGTPFYESGQQVVEKMLDVEGIDCEPVLRLKADNFYFIDGQNSQRAYTLLKETL